VSIDGALARIPAPPASVVWTLRALSPVLLLAWLGGAGWFLWRAIFVWGIGDAGPGVDMVIAPALAVASLSALIPLLPPNRSVDAVPDVVLDSRRIIRGAAWWQRLSMIVAAIPLGVLIGLVGGGLLLGVGMMLGQVEPSPVPLVMVPFGVLTVFGVIAVARAVLLGIELTPDAMVIRGLLRTRRLARTEVAGATAGHWDGPVAGLLRMSGWRVLRIDRHDGAAPVPVAATAGGDVSAAARTIRAWAEFESIPPRAGRRH
jgi:hypothetical protein